MELKTFTSKVKSNHTWAHSKERYLKHIDEIFQKRRWRYWMSVTLLEKQKKKIIDEYESVCKTEREGTR
jgi:ribosomal protein S8